MTHCQFQDDHLASQRRRLSKITAKNNRDAAKEDFIITTADNPERSIKSFKGISILHNKHFIPDYQ